MTVRIFTIGGSSWDAESAPRLHRHLITLTGKSSPRVCFIPTASGDDQDYIDRFFEWSIRDGFIGSVYCLTRPSSGIPRESLLEPDLIYVGGGNTARMLELWRGRGIDVLLARAAQNGTLLAGSSAGMNCWFECCVTDSFGPLQPLNDGLQLLPGSGCPHIDTQPDRLPKFRELVAAGMPPGYALDDGTGILFEDGNLVGAFIEKAHNRALRIQLSGNEIQDQIITAHLI